MDMKSMRRQMDVNFFGTAEMAQVALRAWLAPGAPARERRHLIMTASVIVYFPIAGYAPYAPSKAAMRSLADALSHEVQLYPQDVRVHLVAPGTILSAGFEREQMTKPEVTKLIEQTDPRQTPDEVAQQAIAGLEKGRYMVTANWFGEVLRWGSLGSSFRNNWFVDGIMAMLIGLIFWPIAHSEVQSKMRSYVKKNGHPGTWKKEKP